MSSRSSRPPLGGDPAPTNGNGTAPHRPLAAEAEPPPLSTAIPVRVAGTRPAGGAGRPDGRSDGTGDEAGGDCNHHVDPPAPPREAIEPAARAVSPAEEVRGAAAPPVGPRLGEDARAVARDVVTLGTQLLTLVSGVARLTRQALTAVAGAGLSMPGMLLGRGAARLAAMPRRQSVALVLLAVVVVTAVGVEAARIAEAVLDGPVAVVAVRARPAVIHDQPGGVGSLTAAPDGSVSVSLDVVGVTAPIVVERVFVLNGSKVRVGTPLVELDPSSLEQDLGQLRLNLQAAKASLAAAISARRGAPLQTAGVTGAYIALQVPQLAGEVSLDEQLLQIGLGNSSSIRSPAAGTVNAVRVVPGQIVTPGQPLLDVVNTALVDVSTGVQLGDLEAIRAGDVATITPAAIPGMNLKGHVVTTSPTTTGGGLEGTVTVQAANDGSHPLPLGTQVFVSIDAPQRAAVSLPVLAVLNLELDPAVFVVARGHARLVPVDVGASDAERVQILSGIPVGAEVAETNLQTLRSGGPVRVSAVQS